MDYRFDFRPPVQQGKYEAVSGRIVELIPHGFRNGMIDSCMILAGIETEEGGRINFIITPATYVVDFTTLRVGMMCTFWHLLGVPVPLIYPPQYRAVVAAQQNNNRSVDVGFYNDMFMNDTGTLQLNMDRRVRIRTTNNQVYQGNPAGKDLVVIYDMSTRSIPAQTTPLEVVVLCE